MSANVSKKVMDECKKFCKVKKRVGMEKELFKLAIASYYGMPAKERSSWSLAQIEKQGL